MDLPERPAAPTSGTIPTFDELLADPEIVALLDFEPVIRKVQVEGGWTREAQREFIARLAFHGSPSKACDEMGKNRTGVTKLYKSPFGESFRAAWDGAVELARQRAATRTRRSPVGVGAIPPSLDHRRKSAFAQAPPEGLPGQVLNERGEWEDETSYRARGDEACDSIRGKLLRCRRLFLSEIAGCPAKRAAFEILTELPVDWDKAERMEAQPDEPWSPVNMHKPDMVLTAESGWMLGEIGYGPDKKAALLQRINDYRAEQGLEAVDFAGDGEGGADEAEGEGASVADEEGVRVRRI